MNWAELRDFILVSMVTFNICLIALVGHTMNRNTALIRSLEVKQAGLESAVDVGILELGRAVNDIEVVTHQLRGIEPYKGE